MIYVLYVLHIIVCLFLILVVLLQQGKGADLSVFGGGSTQTAFGARGAATLLHKLTVASFVIFILTTLGIAVLKGGGGSASVMSDVMAERAEDLTTGEEVTEEGEAAPQDVIGEEAAGEDVDGPVGEVEEMTEPEAPEDAPDGASQEAP